MMTISESPLARKIRALMAKANDKSVTEAEAAAYAAKVQELLVKNGLFIKRAMPNVRYTAARPIRGGADGMSAGRSAAAGISLYSQVGGGTRGGGRLAIGKG